MKLLRSRFHHRWCLRSKAAILILIWNFLLAICLQSYFDPTFYPNLLRTQADVMEMELHMASLLYSFSSILWQVA